jgi:hypothetical protein
MFAFPPRLSSPAIVAPGTELRFTQNRPEAMGETQCVAGRTYW